MNASRSLFHVRDRLLTQLQETGRCRVEGLLVAEIVELISVLGLDGRRASVTDGWLVIEPEGE